MDSPKVLGNSFNNLTPKHITGQIMGQQNKGNGTSKLIIFLYLYNLYQICLKHHLHKHIVPIYKILYIEDTFT